MVQYGMLASNPTRATAEQQALEAKLLERVIAIKGTSRQIYWHDAYFRYFERFYELFPFFILRGCWTDKHGDE